MQTYSHFFDSSVWCLGVIPELDQRDRVDLVKDDKDAVGDSRKDRSQPHVLGVLCVIYTVHQLVRSSEVIGNTG